MFFVSSTDKTIALSWQQPYDMGAALDFYEVDYGLPGMDDDGE